MRTLYIFACLCDLDVDLLVSCFFFPTLTYIIWNEYWRDISKNSARIPEPHPFVVAKMVRVPVRCVSKVVMIIRSIQMLIAHFYQFSLHCLLFTDTHAQGSICAQ